MQDIPQEGVVQKLLLDRKVNFPHTAGALSTHLQEDKEDKDQGDNDSNQQHGSHVVD